MPMDTEVAVEGHKLNFMLFLWLKLAIFTAGEKAYLCMFLFYCQLYNLPCL